MKTLLILIRHVNLGCAGIILLVLSMLFACRAPEDSFTSLRGKLQAYTDTLDAQVGIALLTEGGDSLTVNNSCRYPLMSVLKFHQALAVCEYLYERHQSLDTLLHVAPGELKPDTWSPLRDKYQTAGRTDSIPISVRELLSYTLQQSDNNACDILFDRILPPVQVTRFLQERTRLNDFNLVYTEDEMKESHARCYENWSTPYAAVCLMAMFLQTDLVHEPYKSFMKETMLACRTGLSRLPAPFMETNAAIGHKTGSGYVMPDGRVSATNDVGFIALPDGSRYAIAVFVKDSGYDEQASEAIIAHVSKLVYTFFLEK